MHNLDIDMRAIVRDYGRILLLEKYLIKNILFVSNIVKCIYILILLCSYNFLLQNYIQIFQVAFDVTGSRINTLTNFFNRTLVHNPFCNRTQPGNCECFPIVLNLSFVKRRISATTFCCHKFKSFGALGSLRMNNGLIMLPFSALKY